MSAIDRTSDTAPLHSEPRRKQKAKLALAFAVGLLFLMPHVVRMLTLHSIRDYTPFSVITPNPTTWDESFLYAAQANTMLQQHRRADDSDSWEHRASLFPYSILPASIEAATASVLAPGHPRTGLAAAQILFHFVFSAAMAWLLMTLLETSGTPSAMLATLALAIMVTAFSLRTLVHGLAACFSTWSNHTFVDTLQASRNPNPNMSYVILLASTLLLRRAMQTRSLGQYSLAGLTGSLLFYSYTYYALPWCAACALLVVLSLWPATHVPRRVVLTLAASCVGAIPYLLWTHASKTSGVYDVRLARLNMFYSHTVSTEGVRLTRQWGCITFALLACWLVTWWRARPQQELDRMHRTFLIVAATALGGIAGINMQILTGFNVQGEFHFTHMVVQPSVAVLVCLLLVWWLRDRQLGRSLWSGAFVILVLACMASQIRAGIDSAPYHRINPSDRALFDWLHANSTVGSVVATTNLRICAELPLYTHNTSLVVNGSRAAGMYEELVDRLLLAHKLVGTTPARLAAHLRGDNPAPDGVQIDSYGLFLFEQSHYIAMGGRDFSPIATLHSVQDYAAMDVPLLLRRFRVDYIYTGNQESPAAIPGWRSQAVLRTPDSILWRFTPDDKAGQVSEAPVSTPKIQLHGTTGQPAVSVVAGVHPPRRDSGNTRRMLQRSRS